MSSTPQREPGAPPSSTPATKAPARVGRISLLQKHPELGAQIANLIASGQFAKDAAATVGVGESTFHHWLEQGRRQKRGRYRDFLELITTAESKRRVLLMGKVTKAAGEPKHWQAATWILTHTDPELFTPNVRVHVTQQLEGAISRLEAEFSNEPQIFARILSALAGSAGVSTAAGDAAGGGEGGDQASGLADPTLAIGSAARVPGARR